MATGNVVVKQPGNSVSDQARRAAENAVRNAQNSGASKKEVIQARDAAKSDFYQNAVKTAGSGGSGGNTIRNELSDPRHQQNLYNAGLIDTPQTFYTRNAMQQGGGAPREINWTEKAQGAYNAGYAESAARQAGAIAQAEAAARTQPRREALEKYEAWRAEHPVAGRITDKIVDIDERLQQTKAGQKLVEYITGNDGEFGYTNKKFDTQYENKEGTVSGAAKEAALSTFNNLRQGTSYLATANRYRLDKKVRPAIENYVEGKSQENVANQDAAAFIRDAYNNPETPVRRDDKGEYITVKNVRVPLDVAKRAEADVYGNNAQSLEIIGGKDTRAQRTSTWGGDRYQHILDTFKLSGLRDKAHAKINQTVPGMALPFIGVNREVNSVIESGLKGATDAVSAAASAPPAIADKTAKTIDLVAGTKSVRDIKILAGAADAEIASKFINPLYTTVQESDYSPQDLAYVAGGFLPDYLMAKTGSIFKNRVVRPGRVHASAAIDNAKIAKTNYLNPLTSEADVAAHASKMLGVSVDFETVNKRLPGVYRLDEKTGKYKVQNVKVNRYNAEDFLQGNTVSKSRAEQRIIEFLNDDKIGKLAQTQKSADYLERAWGNPSKFLPENQPRRLRTLVSERIDEFKIDPQKTFFESRAAGFDPVNATEMALRQIEINSRIGKISNIIRGKPELDAVRLSLAKKQVQDATRRRYGDYVSRIDVDDISKYIGKPKDETEQLLRASGLSEKDFGTIRSIDDLETFSGIRPPDTILRMRRRGTAIVPTEKGVLVVKEGDVWNLPGGGLRKKERSDLGTLRELFEETKIEGTVAEIEPAFTVAGKPHKDYRGGMFVDRNDVYVIDSFRGKPAPSHEIREIGYYKPGSGKRLGSTAQKILDQFYENIPASGRIPQVPKNKNLYGIHATGDNLPKVLPVKPKGRSESPGLYIGMDTMAAPQFLGINARIRLGFGLNRKVPTLERFIIPQENVANLDTFIPTKNGGKTIRKSFQTKSEPVFIGRNKTDTKRIESQFTVWNEEIIPAAKREGKIASQLPKYGLNTGKDLIEHEMGIFDQSVFVKNPWDRGYTFYKGKYVDVPTRVFINNPAKGTPLPDFGKIPAPASVKKLSEKKALAEARDEYVLRGETRINKITRKKTELIPIGREISDKEFKRLTRPGIVDSALEIGYDTYRVGTEAAKKSVRKFRPFSRETRKRDASFPLTLEREKKLTSKRPRSVDKSFEKSFTETISVRAGAAHPFNIIANGQSSPSTKSPSKATKTATLSTTVASFSSATTSASSGSGSSGRSSKASSSSSSVSKSSSTSSSSSVPGGRPAIPRMIPPVWLPTMPEKGKKQESKSPTKRQVRVNRLADPLEFLLGGKPAAPSAKKTEKKKKKTARRRD